MLLAAGEVCERVGELLLRDDAQVHLHARGEADAGLRVALADDLRHARRLDERVHDLRGVVGAGEEVDVLDRLLPAPQAAGNANPVNSLRRLEVGDELLRDRHRVAQQVLPGVLLVEVDALQDLLLGLLAESLERRPACSPRRPCGAPRSS